MKDIIEDIRVRFPLEVKLLIARYWHRHILYELYRSDNALQTTLKSIVFSNINISSGKINRTNNQSWFKIIKKYVYSLEAVHDCLECSANYMDIQNFRNVHDIGKIVQNLSITNMNDSNISKFDTLISFCPNAKISLEYRGGKVLERPWFNQICSLNIICGNINNFFDSKTLLLSLRELKLEKLDCTKLDNSELGDFNRFPNLRKLLIQFVKSPRAIKNLNTLRKLEYLEIKGKSDRSLPHINLQEFETLKKMDNLLEIKLDLPDAPRSINLKNLIVLERLSIYISERSYENTMLTLDNLRSLKKISLSNNILFSNDGEYDNLQVLEYKNLPNSANHINFSTITNVKSLHLENCEIQSSHFLKHLSNLEKLSLPKNKLSSIEEFEKPFTTLRILNLSNNQINCLENFHFNKTFPNLVNLNLSYNSIEKITNLSNLTNLKVLSLHSNQISTINSGLENLTKLETLDLQNNKIETIEGLDGLSSLIQLTIGRNNLREIKNLKHLKNLEVLDLSRNKITEMSEISHLVNLMILNLSNNCIKKIEGLDNLVFLGLSYFHNNDTEETVNIEES